LKLKVTDVAMDIPIGGLKSGDGTLDEHMAEALKVAKYPVIRAVLKSYEVTGRNSDGTFQVRASIDLTVAGTTRSTPVELTVAFDGTQARVRGQKQLLMTDFNVDPPTLLLGTIRAANEIAIRFDLSIGAKKTTDRESK
jgi:polyisoprenoid-binding protein YceI